LADAAGGARVAEAPVVQPASLEHPTQMPSLPQTGVKVGHVSLPDGAHQQDAQSR
jgi:hypothetical protein